MDINMPLASVVFICSILASGGVAWGTIKLEQRINSRRLNNLEEHSMNKIMCDALREGCSGKFKQEFLDLQKSMHTFEKSLNNIAKKFEDYDRKREEARNENQAAMLEITKFMGKVSEYMRLKNGVHHYHRRTDDINDEIDK